MRKKIFSFLLALVTSVGLMNAAVDDSGPCGANVTYSFNGATGAMTITGTGPMTNFESRSEAPWCSYSDDITSVTITDGVTSVGSYSFGYYDNLVSVTIGNDVETIGYYAFGDCYKFTTLNLGNSVRHIGDRAFMWAKVLTGFTLPSTLETIGERAFLQNKVITSLTIPSNVTSIGEAAFFYCAALTSVTVEATTPPTLGATVFDYVPTSSIPLYVPNGSVAAYTAADQWNAFNIQGYDPAPTPANVCGDGLTWELSEGELTISYDGEGTGEMYDFGYEYDENPVNVAPWKENKSDIATVVIGDGVKSIGNYAFNDLSENFTAVTIANSVERIGVFAFTNSEEITEITLPSSLKTIDERGFANCGFTSITIPSGVTSIGYQAFSYCRDLTSLTCEATTPPTLGTGVFYKIRSSTSSISSIPLYVPSESVDAYTAAAQWNAFDIQAIPSAPTYLDADFAIDFRTDPYTKVGGGDLPAGVLVEGSMNTGDPQHGYRLPVITIPVTAGNYKVMMGTCSYSNQDGSVKNEDGTVTYATLATNNGTCYHNNTTANVVGAIFTVPTDQIIKVYGAEYTPFFSIEKMAAVPAFTDFELNFQTNPYNEISGAKPEGTVIIGTYHDNLHGYQNVEAVVPVETGNYRLTVGACEYGTPGNVMSETNAELASFNSNLGEGNCYHNNTAANIVSTIFTVDMDQTITINGGAYMPYMKLEKLLDNTYYINFENAEGAIGTVPGEIAVAAGESWTIPANLTLYKEGYTFVGWSDGVNTYAPGDEFFPSAHGTLQAVYTPNSVSIADASTINVKWYFGENAGAPSVTWQGTTGYLLAKGEVDGELIDLKLDIDATSGKFHNAGRGDKWAQVNANTVFTFPSKEGAVVNVETYSGNATYDLAAGTLTCNTNDYYSYLEVVYPAPTTAVEIGDLNSAEEVDAFLTTYNGQPVPDLTIKRPVLNNMYNTLCLPFHMDADQIANSSLNGVEIYEFIDVDVTNDELYLYTSEQKHEIVAGRPYLVKFSAASQLNKLNFINVVINNADLDDQAVTIKGVTFKGTFQPIVLGAQEGLDFNGGHLFLMTNNTLMWPNTNNALKPFRAYFTVNVDAGQSAGMPVRRGMAAHIGGPAQIVTGVENVQGDNVQGDNVQGTKVVENGVLYIMYKGTKYNVQGQEVK